MKIVNSSIAMEASRLATQTTQVQESLRMWSRSATPSAPTTNGNVTLSAKGLVLAQAIAKAGVGGNDGLSSELQLLIALVEKLTGHKITPFNMGAVQSPTPTAGVSDPSGTLPASADGASPTAANPTTPDASPTATNTPPVTDASPTTSNAGTGGGFAFDYWSRYHETEQTTFAAQGVVQTADGQTIKFSVSLAMQRDYSETTSISIHGGDPEPVAKDPLVINFSGTAAQLTDAKFSFDLNSDGASGNINFSGPGSGFLVFDKNHDGQANNGSELFGPSTGNGFGELKALDKDGNGWIDESDSAYADLRVWSKDAKGQDQWQTLKDAGVGAISVDQLATPFTVKDASNTTRAQITASGVWLGDNGTAGSVQQIDLVV